MLLEQKAFKFTNFHTTKNYMGKRIFADALQLNYVKQPGANVFIFLCSDRQAAKQLVFLY